MTNLIRWSEHGPRQWASRLGGRQTFDAASAICSTIRRPRRQHWYVTHSITNTSRCIGIGAANNAGIPLSQPASAALAVIGVEFNPTGGNQDQEFVCISNPAPFAVDISDGNSTAACSSPSRRHGACRRTASLTSRRTHARSGPHRRPARWPGTFVLGPYKGQLSARGETVSMINPSARREQLDYTGDSERGAAILRITELMYHPSPHAANPSAENSSTRTEEHLDQHTVASPECASRTAWTSTSPAARSRVLAPGAVSGGEKYCGVHRAIRQQLPSPDNTRQSRKWRRALQLIDANNEEILDFSYDDSGIRHGRTRFLARGRDESADRIRGTTNRNGARVAASAASGVVDPAPGDRAHSHQRNSFPHRCAAAPDSIELYNPTASAVNISGWFLSDDFNTPKNSASRTARPFRRRLPRLFRS
jgi:hypothetical protein